MPTAHGRTCREFIVASLSNNESVMAFPAALLDPSDGDGRFLFANERFERLSGYRGTEVHNRPLSVLFGARTDPQTRLHARTGMVDGTTVQADLLCYRRSGEVFWNRMNFLPVRDETSEVVAMLVTMQDVTRIRRLEDALLGTDAINARTRRSLQIVIDKTEARYSAVHQFQAMLVQHLSRSWRRQVAREQREGMIERRRRNLAPTMPPGHATERPEPEFPIAGLAAL